MKMRVYNVTVYACVSVDAELTGEEAEEEVRDQALAYLSDTLRDAVEAADVEATDEYEEEDE